jgi:hypothetical protein
MLYDSENYVSAFENLAILSSPTNDIYPMHHSRIAYF